MIETRPTVRPRQGRADHRGPDREADPVIAHTGLAVTLARRYAGRGETLDDLKQVAMLALVKASHRFDETRGTAFSTFATATVDGELKRHFRQRWGLHVRRGDQERYLAVREAEEILTHRLSRPPTIAELSASTGIDPRKVRVAIDVGSAFGVESLDSATGRGVGGEPCNPDDPFERFDQLASLQPLLAALPERQREILRLKFGEELPQTEIARRLGISQMQVSRLLARTLRDLRQRLAG